MDIKRARIVLIGAAGGIGAAIAKLLAHNGADLLLVGRNEKSLSTLRASLEWSGRHDAISADIATADGRSKLLAYIRNYFPQPEVVIQCAAISSFGALEHTAPERIEALLQTNLSAPILLTQGLLPLLKPTGARLLMVGSSFGGIGYPGFAAYCASKFGLRGFSEALRRELADGPHQVAYLAPRATKTALNSSAICDMNEALGTATDEPERVAEIVLQMLQATRMSDRAIGMPERLFLKINALLPSVVDGALRKKLAVIKSFFARPHAPSVQRRELSKETSTNAGEFHV